MNPFKLFLTEVEKISLYETNKSP